MLVAPGETGREISEMRKQSPPVGGAIYFFELANVEIRNEHCKMLNRITGR
jgi:hypothetical protein